MAEARNLYLDIYLMVINMTSATLQEVPHGDGC
jgi:hypothetical protein